MKPMNAAERIRESLGCYNIMLHKPEPQPKKKKVRYGDILKAHFDDNRHKLKRRKPTEPVAKTRPFTHTLLAA